MGENGFKSHETHYLMGNLHGKTYSWNEKGHLVSKSSMQMENLCTRLGIL